MLLWYDTCSIQGRPLIPPQRQDLKSLLSNLLKRADGKFPPGTCKSLRNTVSTGLLTYLVAIDSLISPWQGTCSNNTGAAPYPKDRARIPSF